MLRLKILRRSNGDGNDGCTRCQLSPSKSPSSLAHQQASTRMRKIARCKTLDNVSPVPTLAISPSKMIIDRCSDRYINARKNELLDMIPRLDARCPRLSAHWLAPPNIPTLSNLHHACIYGIRRERRGEIKHCFVRYIVWTSSRSVDRSCMAVVVSPRPVL